ncbi:MAG: hypothetical protein EOP38_09340 [Rubrivivax sp.]|nr:MAG: hypothetical protein EOP38_09340 [Rubrivivax sp.]
MLRPLLQLVATEPELLTDHLQSYAELLGEEVGAYKGQVKRRWLLTLVLALMVTVTVLLGGIALMFWLITPDAQLQQLQVPWAVWLVPGGMAAVCALTAVMIKHEEHHPGFETIRAQIAADVAMLKEATAS